MAAQAARVLVVDDDKNQRNMLVFALETCGYRVTAVAGGGEALAAAAKETFDAAICDVMMPGLDGVKTLERLRAVAPKMRVIMATGYATAQTAAKSKTLGAFNYLAKPYEMNDLLDVLERALRDGREPA
ncbi:MAG: response regulator [Elusimicrobiota bacterium]|nr:response regulator [Elusimicrobiota bacterium]